MFHGQSFDFIKERRNKTRVFQSQDKTQYLRIGPALEIKREAGFHRRLLAQGYPVPKILEEGDGESGESYYVETSVGTEKFGAIFGRECKESGSVNDASFGQFIGIVRRYLEAQVRTATETQNWEAVFLGTHFDFLLEEMQDEKSSIEAVWEKVIRDLEDVPFVLCHGDFNAFNVLPGGVIDFETPFDGPLGYDFVSVLISNSWFPQKGDFEVLSAYVISSNQIKKLMRLAPDTIKNFDALFLLRSSWAVVRMQKFPKLQAWRYRLFREAMNQYLKGNSLYDWWQTMPQE